MTAPRIVSAREVPLAKAHVKGYTREDGTTVSGYERDGGPGKASSKVSVQWPFKAGGGKVVAAAEKPSGAPQAALAALADTKAKLSGEKAPSDFQAKWGMGKPSKVIGAQFGGKLPGQGSLFGGSKYEPKPEPKLWHPRPGDKGEKVGIYHPHKESDAASWSDPEATATVVAGGDAPAELHGIPFKSWADAPTTLEQWADVPGQNDEVPEPDFECPDKLEPAAGVVIEEEDGRVWLVSPTNAFGGYRNTFPKGRADDGLHLQAVAIKEAYEESGLQVEITGFVGDFPRSQTYTRIYRARRVGGTPKDMGWESQAVRLAPKGALHLLLNGPADQPVRKALDER